MSRFDHNFLLPVTNEVYCLSQQKSVYMNKVLGLDLGTNSIGWAIRTVDEPDNQITHFGVLTFNKGVGVGKTGEFSYAAERTKKRSARRLYQARKYRLWKTLEHLINEGYCPLSIAELNKWRYYNKEEALLNKNGGRVYPLHNKLFDAWIKLDFNGDGVPDYTSPYQLRSELADRKIDLDVEQNRFKLGRALYHIAQRRGFKSSRKVAGENMPSEDAEEVVDLKKSEKKKNQEIIKLLEENPEAKTIGQLFALLERKNERIREKIAQHAIRENYKDEIKFIFSVQELGSAHPLYVKLVESGKNKNDGSIFYKRPLRSQKGLVGRCTLEPHKYRAPISHPAFETFRAWAFLNNIKYKVINDEGKDWKRLPLDLKQFLLKEKFLRKSRPYFSFAEIEEVVKARGFNWKLNYKSTTTIAGCPVSVHLKGIFGEDFLNVKIQKPKAPNTEKDYYDIEDIWHVLFSFEDQEFVSEFGEEKLRLDQEKTRRFVNAWNAIPEGYSMLSLKAIRKINRFLEKGLIYTEAVLLANLPEIIGEDKWAEKEEYFLEKIGFIISENRTQKSILAVVNNLISKHKNLTAIEKFGYKDNTYRLDNSDIRDIANTISDTFGKEKWEHLSSTERDRIFESVKDCYQAYFINSGLRRVDINGERHFEVHTNGCIYYKTDSGYYRMPKLIDTLADFLRDNFGLNEKVRDLIYHPSEIEIYPPAKPDKDGVLKLGSPKTGSYKNPMAMRTLHQLRKLINHLVEKGTIDSDTRVVVEVARELNDANKRWAIEAWQRQRENENKEFAEAIARLLKEEEGIQANPDSPADIDKLRLFSEQVDEETLPPVEQEVEQEDEKPSKKKKEKKRADAVFWTGMGKNLLDRYRLWKEQGCLCMYTGKVIPLSELFRPNIIDIEHTIPRSISFDDSMANQTVCYADYNRQVKRKQFPTQLVNYDKDYGKFKAILPRLDAWKDRVERIKQQIEFWQNNSKKALDKDTKDKAIRQKHLWKMELDYWQNKLDRFLMTEVTAGFKNSQLVDTQLISKYALHYLKTYFNRVDVQKGRIVSAFRKIYNLENVDEKKDRSKHSHHAKDAAVLTLIPVAAQRDNILAQYYEARENNLPFFLAPYKSFSRQHIVAIEDAVLINNSVKDQTLTPGRKKVRKRGKEQMIPGTNRIMWATGDCIRGQLHQEKFYGAIKRALRDETGKLLKDENGKILHEEEVTHVIREPFVFKKDDVSPGFKSLDDIKKRVVDPKLVRDIEDQVSKHGSLREAMAHGIYLLDKEKKPHGSPIRHVRVWANIKEPLKIKLQTNLSRKKHKQYYLAANATNSYFAIYEGEGKRTFELKNLFDIAKTKNQIPVSSVNDLFEARKIVSKGKKQIEMGLKYVLRSGLKVLFRKDEHENLKSLDVVELLKRLYVFTNFEKDGRLNFRYHLEARKDISEEYSDSEIDFEIPKPTLRFSYNKYDFLLEGVDFDVEMDGMLLWK